MSEAQKVAGIAEKDRWLEAVNPRILKKDEFLIKKKVTTVPESKYYVPDTDKRY